MSAFVCILERSGDPVDGRQLERLAAPLASYGAELSTFCRGAVGIAVRRRGGPAAGLRNGPQADSATGMVAAVAGRFRTIDESAAAGSTATASGLADPAAQALAAVGATGAPSGRRALLEANWLAGLSGAFVLVAADAAGARMEVVRDPLGSLKVYYYLDRHRLIAASEPAAILRFGGISSALDEVAAARFLGFRFSPTERSFFRRIRELRPAHRLWVTSTEARSERYWRFRRRDAIGRLSAAGAADEFRRRLRSAVADDLAGLEPRRVAVSLSGGLDSPAIAALAPRGVELFSWTFERDSQADERVRVEAVARHLDLPVHWVRGDGLHPLCGEFAERFVHENSPYVNAFSALKSRLYAAARAAGCKRVLVGDGGDAVYAASDYWLLDALAAREPGAFSGLGRTLFRAARGAPSARRALRGLLPRRGRGELRRRQAPWLTPAARAALAEEPPPSSSSDADLSCRHELVAGFKHSELESEEQRLFADCGVERGNPFWSWPLLEMTLALPAFRLHRDGRDKVLSREALRGLLPVEVLDGRRGGLLGRFFLRGVEERRDALRARVFRRPRSDWQRWVRREWLEPFLADTGALTFGHTILWRVICYELWCRRLAGEG